MFFRIAAIVIMLAFYITYFAKLFSQRKKGIQTDKLGKGKSVQVRVIETSLRIVSYLLPAAEITAIVIGSCLAPLSLRMIGAVIGVAGDAIFIISVLTMRDNWRAGVPENEKTELVTNGIYRYSRNPAFLGFDLVYASIVLMFFSCWLLALTVLAMIIFHIQIVFVEERFLTDSFGEQYTRYCSEVGRYFGRKSRKQRSRK